VIARTWRGVVATRDRDAYVTYINETGGAEYERAPGCSSWMVLTRDLEDAEGVGGRTEVVAFSLWESLTALQGFTGPDVEAMVLYPEDDAYLLESPTLQHHVVATHSARG
jgi:hypothetical protein